MTQGKWFLSPAFWLPFLKIFQKSEKTISTVINCLATYEKLCHRKSLAEVKTEEFDKNEFLDKNMTGLRSTRSLLTFNPKSMKNQMCNKVSG